MKAFDGAFEDFCTVKIKISNVNDNPPVFRPYDGKITIVEEEILNRCITTVIDLKLFSLLFFTTKYYPFS